VDALEALRSRVSVNQFDPSRGLTEDEVRELIAYATEAPSSFNIQHWRFVAVIRPEDKARMRSVAYNQRKITDAAVVFIVLGDLRAHETLGPILDRSVRAGVITQRKRDAWVRTAEATYGKDPVFARDETIRSASLASMALMIAAEAKGLASAPIIGFDGPGVVREFGIDERYVLVMLLPVGYPAPGNGPRLPRLSVDEVLAFHRARQF
jgi:nitroreductase